MQSGPRPGVDRIIRGIRGGGERAGTGRSRSSPPAFTERSGAPAPRSGARGPIILGALGLAVVLGAHRPASAQSAGAQAEAMFREGRTLLNAGKVAEACAAFEASHKLEPAMSTLMNLAACRERNGQFATAWGLFLDAERQTRGGTDDANRRLHQVALERATKLEPRISKLTINVSADSQIDRLEILRGADVIDPAMWNRALPVDGGRYKITARAPGAAAWTSEIEIAHEGDVKTVEIPKLQSVVGLPAAAHARGRAPESVAGPSDAGEGARGARLPLVIAGGGALLLGGAVGAILWGNSSYDQARAEQTSQARRDSLYSSANTKRHVALGLAAAGIACGGVAAWLYISGRTGERSATSAVAARTRVVPVVDSTGVGLVILGGF